MKVKDLIAKLSELDPELDVYAYMEDERFATDDHRFWFLHVSDAETTRAVLVRGDDGVPTAKFVSTDDRATTIATIQVSSDF
jgi:hypothetical protein